MAMLLEALGYVIVFYFAVIFVAVSTKKIILKYVDIM